MYHALDFSRGIYEVQLLLDTTLPEYACLVYSVTIQNMKALPTWIETSQDIWQISWNLYQIKGEYSKH